MLLQKKKKKNLDALVLKSPDSEVLCKQGIYQILVI